MSFLERPPGPERLRINSCGWSRCAPDWAWSSRSWKEPDFDLWVVCAGSGRMETPEGVLPFAAGDCFLLRGPELYRGHQDPGPPLVVSHTHFDLLDADGRVWRPGAASWPPLLRRIAEMEVFAGILRRLLEASLQERDGCDARGWLAAALLEVARQDRRHAGDADPLRERIERICAEIVDDPAARWTVAGMARRCGCSVDHFTRRFKDLKGVPPQEWCVRVRLQRAATLLRFGDEAVGVIAETLGYGDVHFFCRQFKQRMGATPSAWRRGERRGAVRDSAAPRDKGSGGGRIGS